VGTFFRQSVYQLAIHSTLIITTVNLSVLTKRRPA